MEILVEIGMSSRMQFGLRLCLCFVSVSRVIRKFKTCTSRHATIFIENRQKFPSSKPFD